MTLLDAPKFDEVRDRRRRIIILSSAGVVAALVILLWILAGFPIDWPWNWYAHFRGRIAVNTFFKAVERNDMSGAYTIWIHDKDWQTQQAQIAAHPFDQFSKEKSQSMDQKAMVKAYGDLVNDKDWQNHKAMLDAYPLTRFQSDWSPTSPDNEYAPIKSHFIAAARMNGNVLVVGVYLNGLKSKPVFLAYDPKAKTLTFSPVELYLGP